MWPPSLGLGRQARMTPEISKELGRLLMSYSGPESGRVRTAIAKLAKDDPQLMEYFVGRAQADYRDVLWRADIQDEEERTKALLGGMTFNERLWHLELDAAVTDKDRKRATAILQKCELTDSNIVEILDAKFGSEP